MSEILVLNEPRKVGYEFVEDRALEAGEIRVRTIYSGISAGTELAAYRGTNPFLNKRWIENSRLFVNADTPSLPYPLKVWGYEEVGEVIEIGSEVTRLKVGDVVYGTWGHRTQQILKEDYACERVKPAELDPMLAIYSHIGPIALNAILDADIHIGETVAIFGLGVLGQVVAQLAKNSGARVIGVDLIKKRLQMAKELKGVDLALDPRDGSAAEKIKELTGGKGADVSIEVSGSAKALNETIRATAYNARVVAMGFLQGEANGLYLGEEFHHNRINLVCSQISNVNPALTHRWDRLRMIHTIMDLQTTGLLNLRPVISHVIPFKNAAEGFRILDETPADAMQIVLDFSEEA